MHRICTKWTWWLALTGVVTGSVLGQVEKPSVQTSIQARRARILEIAERYRSHVWRASQKHRFHGIDKSGTRVDTPDKSYRKDGFKTDGSPNTGIPYKWGGFSSIEQFDRGLELGFYAGHLPRRGSSASSAQALGVDCSGLVSRCWDLPSKESTRSLGHLCYRLDGYADLLPGDAINLFDKHVMLFKDFVGKGKQRVRVIESAGVGVRERVISVNRLKKAGFLPLRYRPLDPRWVGVDFQSPSFRAAGKPASKEEVATSDEPGSWRAAQRTEKAPGMGLISELLRRSRAGQWVRYETRLSGGKSAPASKALIRIVSRAAARIHDGAIEIQEYTQIGDRTKATSASHRLDSKPAHWLMAFPAIGMALEGMHITQSKVLDGSYLLGNRRVEAWRVDAHLEGKLLVRSRRYPVGLDIECFVSKEVPLYGILRARYDMTAHLGENAKGEKRVSRMTLTYRLKDFFDPGSK